MYGALRPGFGKPCLYSHHLPSLLLLGLFLSSVYPESPVRPGDCRPEVTAERMLWSQDPV